MHTARSLHQPTYRREIERYITVTCLRWKIRRADIDDIVQEAWAEILDSVASFRPEKGTVVQWACGVGRHVIHRYLRDRVLYLEHFSEYHPNVDDHPSPEPTPEGCVQGKQAAQDVAHARCALSPKQDAVLEMHVLDNLTHGEIGAVLRMSEAASQKCFQRACNRMAECVTVDLWAVMPPDLASCNDSSPRKDAPMSRRIEEWSHYAGQIVALLLLFFVPLTTTQSRFHAWIERDITKGTSLQNNAMYTFDKRVFVHDEPTARHDAPARKPEPASLPSVRDVSTATRTQGKPSLVWQLSPLPPHKHGAPTKSYRQRAWREPQIR